jgi:hypothetical protein
VKAERRALARRARRREWRRRARFAVAEFVRNEYGPGAVEVYRVSGRHRRPCPCGVCEAREAIQADRELSPGEVPHTAESLAIHDAETARELALWHRWIWRPGRLAELRAFAAAVLRAWARRRAGRAGRAASWRRPGRGWIEAGLGGRGAIHALYARRSETWGDVAARRSEPRTGAAALGAPVIWT